MGLLALLLCLPATALAGSLFSSETPLALEIKTDFSALTALSSLEEKSFPATITVGEQTFSAELQPRGRMRREVCKALPPLKLILPKRHRPPPFEKMDRDLKIVTSCVTALPDKSAAFPLYRELLQYKLLNAAGFSSFLVRLADITYRNASGEIISQTPAFFIENIKDFARRRGLGKKTPAPPSLELQAELLVAESFLENYDFFVPNSSGEDNHNVRTVSNGKKELVAMVPFDFDLSLISRGGVLPSSESIAASFRMLGPPAAKKQILGQLLRLSDKKAELLAELEKSPLPEEEKAPLRQWINDYAEAVQAYSNSFSTEN